MLEWLKRHVWKACDRPKRFQGSNPCLSARKIKILQDFASRQRCKIRISATRRELAHERAADIRIKWSQATKS